MSTRYYTDDRVSEYPDIRIVIQDLPSKISWKGPPFLVSAISQLTMLALNGK